MRPGVQRLLSATRTLHIYLSLLGLGLLMFFAVTGFMLLHKESFGVDNSQEKPGPTGTMPGWLAAARDEQKIEDFIRKNFFIRAERKKDDKLDFEQPELVMSFERAGQSTAVKITPRKATTEARSETEATLPATSTTQPAAAADYDVVVTHDVKSVAGLLADLHTARSVGRVWRLCLDGAAILLMAASLTGLLVWLGLPKRRVLGLAATIVGVAACAAVYVWLVV